MMKIHPTMPIFTTINGLKIPVYKHEKNQHDKKQGTYKKFVYQSQEEREQIIEKINAHSVFKNAGIYIESVVENEILGIFLKKRDDQHFIHEITDDNLREWEKNLRLGTHISKGQLLNVDY